MNRAWMIRAEQRLVQLEQRVKQLDAEVLALKAEQNAEPIEAAKRGPGRPRKVESVEAS